MSQSPPPVLGGGGGDVKSSSYSAVDTDALTSKGGSLSHTPPSSGAVPLVVSNPHNHLLTLSPEELIFTNVRLNQAYAQSVVVSNPLDVPVEFSIRAGSAERYSVSPSHVRLGAGCSAVVEVRLKLLKYAPLDRKHPTNQPMRQRKGQRDTFHIKSALFDQKFFALFYVWGVNPPLPVPPSQKQVTDASSEAYPRIKDSSNTSANVNSSPSELLSTSSPSTNSLYTHNRPSSSSSSVAATPAQPASSFSAITPASSKPGEVSVLTPEQWIDESDPEISPQQQPQATVNSSVPPPPPDSQQQGSWPGSRPQGSSNSVLLQRKGSSSQQKQQQQEDRQRERAWHSQFTQTPTRGSRRARDAESKYSTPASSRTSESSFPGLTDRAVGEGFSSGSQASGAVGDRSRSRRGQRPASPTGDDDLDRLLARFEGNQADIDAVWDIVDLCGAQERDDWDAKSRKVMQILIAKDSQIDLLNRQLRELRMDFGNASVLQQQQSLGDTSGVSQHGNSGIEGKQPSTTTGAAADDDDGLSTPSAEAAPISQVVAAEENQESKVNETTRAEPPLVLLNPSEGDTVSSFAYKGLLEEHAGLEKQLKAAREEQTRLTQSLVAAQQSLDLQTQTTVSLRTELDVQALRTAATHAEHKLVQKKAADALDKLRASQETAATLSEELERVNDFRARAAAYMQSELLQQEQIDTLMQEVQDLRAVPAEPMSDAHSSGGVDSGPSAEAQAELIVALENQLKVSHLRETELSMELAQTQEHLQATLDEADQQRSSVISVATPSSSSKRPAATATINAETPDPNNRGLSPSPSPSSSSSAKKRSKHAANAGGGELSAIRAARRAANARIKDMSAALDTKTTEIETLKAKLLKYHNQLTTIRKQMSRVNADASNSKQTVADLRSELEGKTAARANFVVSAKQFATKKDGSTRSNPDAGDSKDGALAVDIASVKEWAAAQLATSAERLADMLPDLVASSLALEGQMGAGAVDNGLVEKKKKEEVPVPVVSVDDVAAEVYAKHSEVVQQLLVVLDDCEASNAYLRQEMVALHSARAELGKSSAEALAHAKDELTHVKRALDRTRTEKKQNVKRLEESIHAMGNRSKLHAKVAHGESQIIALRRSESRLRDQMQAMEQKNQQLITQVDKFKAQDLQPSSSSSSSSVLPPAGAPSSSNQPSADMLRLIARIEEQANAIGTLRQKLSLANTRLQEVPAKQSAQAKKNEDMQGILSQLHSDRDVARVKQAGLEHENKALSGLSAEFNTKLLALEELQAVKKSQWDKRRRALEIKAQAADDAHAEQLLQRDLKLKQQEQDVQRLKDKLADVKISLDKERRGRTWAESGLTKSHKALAALRREHRGDADAAIAAADRMKSLLSEKSDQCKILMETLETWEASALVMTGQGRGEDSGPATDAADAKTLSALDSNEGGVGVNADPSNSSFEHKPSALNDSFETFLSEYTDFDGHAESQGALESLTFLRRKVLELAAQLSTSRAVEGQWQRRAAELELRVNEYAGSVAGLESKLAQAQADKESVQVQIMSNAAEHTACAKQLVRFEAELRGKDEEIANVTRISMAAERTAQQAGTDVEALQAEIVGLQQRHAGRLQVMKEQQAVALEQLAKQSDALAEDLTPLRISDVPTKNNIFDTITGTKLVSVLHKLLRSFLPHGSNDEAALNESAEICANRESVDRILAVVLQNELSNVRFSKELSCARWEVEYYHSLFRSAEAEVLEQQTVNHLLEARVTELGRLCAAGFVCTDAHAHERLSMYLQQIQSLTSQAHDLHLRVLESETKHEVLRHTHAQTQAQLQHLRRLEDLRTSDKKATDIKMMTEIQERANTRLDECVDGLREFVSERVAQQLTTTLGPAATDDVVNVVQDLQLALLAAKSNEEQLLERLRIVADENAVFSRTMRTQHTSIEKLSQQLLELESVPTHDGSGAHAHTHAEPQSAQLSAVYENLEKDRLITELRQKSEQLELEMGMLTAQRDNVLNREDDIVSEASANNDKMRSELIQQQHKFRELLSAKMELFENLQHRVGASSRAKTGAAKYTSAFDDKHGHAVIDARDSASQILSQDAVSSIVDEFGQMKDRDDLVAKLVEVSKQHMLVKLRLSECQDELSGQTNVVAVLRASLSKMESAVHEAQTHAGGKHRGKKQNIPFHAFVKMLASAKEEECDALRKLRLASRTELELRDTIDTRDARIKELKEENATLQALSAKKHTPRAKISRRNSVKGASLSLTPSSLRSGSGGRMSKRGSVASLHSAPGRGSAKHSSGLHHHRLPLLKPDEGVVDLSTAVGQLQAKLESCRKELASERKALGASRDGEASRVLRELRAASGAEMRNAYTETSAGLVDEGELESEHLKTEKALQQELGRAHALITTLQNTVRELSVFHDHAPAQSIPGSPTPRMSLRSPRSLRGKKSNSSSFLSDAPTSDVAAPDADGKQGDSAAQTLVPHAAPAPRSVEEQACASLQFALQSVSDRLKVEQAVLAKLQTDYGASQRQLASAKQAFDLKERQLQTDLTQTESELGTASEAQERISAESRDLSIKLRAVQKENAKLKESMRQLSVENKSLHADRANRFQTDSSSGGQTAPVSVNPALSGALGLMNAPTSDHKAAAKPQKKSFRKPVFVGGRNSPSASAQPVKGAVPFMQVPAAHDALHEQLVAFFQVLNEQLNFVVASCVVPESLSQAVQDESPRGKQLSKGKRILSDASTTIAEIGKGLHTALQEYKRVLEGSEQTAAIAECKRLRTKLDALQHQDSASVDKLRREKDACASALAIATQELSELKGGMALRESELTETKKEMEVMNQQLLQSSQMLANRSMVSMRDMRERDLLRHASEDASAYNSDDSMTAPTPMTGSNPLSPIISITPDPHSRRSNRGRGLEEGVEDAFSRSVRSSLLSPPERKPRSTQREDLSVTAANKKRRKAEKELKTKTKALSDAKAKALGLATGVSMYRFLAQQLEKKLSSEREGEGVLKEMPNMQVGKVKADAEQDKANVERIAAIVQELRAENRDFRVSVEAAEAEAKAGTAEISKLTLLSDTQMQQEKQGHEEEKDRLTSELSGLRTSTGHLIDTLEARMEAQKTELSAAREEMATMLHRNKEMLMQDNDNQAVIQRLQDLVHETRMEVATRVKQQQQDLSKLLAEEKDKHRAREKALHEEFVGYKEKSIALEQKRKDLVEKIKASKQARSKSAAAFEQEKADLQQQTDASMVRLEHERQAIITKFNVSIEEHAAEYENYKESQTEYARVLQLQVASMKAKLVEFHGKHAGKLMRMLHPKHGVLVPSSSSSPSSDAKSKTRIGKRAQLSPASNTSKSGTSESGSDSADQTAQDWSEFIMEISKRDAVIESQRARMKQLARSNTELKQGLNRMAQPSAIEQLNHQKENSRPVTTHSHKNSALALHNNNNKKPVKKKNNGSSGTRGVDYGESFVLRTRLSNVQTKLRALQGQMELEQDRRTSVELTLEECRGHLLDSRSQVKVLKQRVADLKGKYRAHTDEQDRAVAVLEGKLAHSQELLKEQHSQEDWARLSGVLQEGKKSYRLAREELSRKSTALGVVRQEQLALEGRVDQLQEDLASKSMRVKKLQGSLESKNRLISGLRDKLETREEEDNVDTKQLETKQEEKTDARVKQLQKSLSRKEDRVLSLKKKLKEVESELECASKDHAKELKERKKWFGSAERRGVQLKQTKELLEASEKANSALETRLSKLQAEHKKIVESHAGAVGKLKALRAEKQEVEVKLRIQEEDLEQSRIQMEQTAQEVREWREAEMERAEAVKSPWKRAFRDERQRILDPERHEQMLEKKKALKYLIATQKDAIRELKQSTMSREVSSEAHERLRVQTEATERMESDLELFGSPDFSAQELKDIMRSTLDLDGSGGVQGDSDVDLTAVDEDDDEDDDDAPVSEDDIKRLEDELSGIVDQRISLEVQQQHAKLPTAALGSDASSSSSSALVASASMKESLSAVSSRLQQYQDLAARVQQQALSANSEYLSRVRAYESEIEDLEHTMSGCTSCSQRLDMSLEFDEHEQEDSRTQPTDTNTNNNTNTDTEGIAQLYS